MSKWNMENLWGLDQANYDYFKAKIYNLHNISKMVEFYNRDIINFAVGNYCNHVAVL